MLNINNGKFCVKCGGKLIEQVTEEEINDAIIMETTQERKIVYKSNWKGIIALVCSFVVLISVIITVSVVKINDYEEQIELKNRTISQKNKKISENQIEISSCTLDMRDYKEKADFLDENIVFVLDGYGRYYYTYDQVQQVTQGEKYSYWAYNKEAAISQGYKAWK